MCVNIGKYRQLPLEKSEEPHLSAIVKKKLEGGRVSTMYSLS